MAIAIASTGIMGPSITNAIISLCITKWAEYARITRGPGTDRTPRGVHYLSLACQALQIHEFCGATFCRNCTATP